MLTLVDPKQIRLHSYQEDAVEALRKGIRQGRKWQVLVAPTGAGKTVIASHLLRQADEKGSYALFLVDRVALVDQTSKTLDRYGIRHGIVQGINDRWSPNENVQVCSIQTLARRSLPRRPSLIIYDECHCSYRSSLTYIAEHPEAVAIGLTATPFTPGMGKHWSGLVNVTTARELINSGYLIEPKIYVARSPEDAELGLNGFGEFSDESAATAGIRIVGDVVAEWMQKTREHFGGPVKTIVFSPSVDHGREVCAAFGAAGFNFQQISYLDRDEAERRAKIDEFRRPDSIIHGLVSCGVLTKGFDVEDVRCGISCKPYRKSLSSHMQEIGRVMRRIEGEQKKAIWLDHSGNIERFAFEMFDVWEHGAGNDLSNAEKRDTKPRERNEETRQKSVCPECSGALRGNFCCACGWERPARSGIVAVEGTMQAFDPAALGLTARAGLRAECVKDPRSVWDAALAYCMDHCPRDENKARRWAYGVWRGVFPDAKLPRGWFDASRRGCDPNAYALIDRETKRFRKQRRAA